MGMDKITSNTLLKCPECDNQSPRQDWADAEIGCEDCGTHFALRCPKCDELIDMATNNIAKMAGVAERRLPFYFAGGFVSTQLPSASSSASSSDPDELTQSPLQTAS